MQRQLFICQQYTLTLVLTPVFTYSMMSAARNGMRRTKVGRCLVLLVSAETGDKDKCTTTRYTPLKRLQN